MPNANYAGWNYSALDQINADNVQTLEMAWTMQLGIQDSHEASPLVIGDTMYIVTPEAELRLRARPHASGGHQVGVPA